VVQALMPVRADKSVCPTPYFMLGKPLEAGKDLIAREKQRERPEWSIPIKEALSC